MKGLLRGKSAAETISNWLIIVLIGISATVTIIIATGENAWRFIVLYWLTLTIKNVLDYIGRVKDDKGRD